MTTLSSAIPTHGNYHNYHGYSTLVLELIRKFKTYFKGIATTTPAGTTPALRSYPPNFSPTPASST